MVAKGQSTEQQYATGLHSSPAYDPQQTTKTVSSGELIQWLLNMYISERDRDPWNSRNLTSEYA